MFGRLLYVFLFLIFQAFSCIAVENQKFFSNLEFPNQYGELLPNNVIEFFTQNNRDNTSNEEPGPRFVNAWDSGNAEVEGWFLNWALFSPSRETDQNFPAHNDLETGKKLKLIDTDRQIPLALSPRDTEIALVEAERNVNSGQIFLQNPDKPQVFHGRIYIENS